MIRFLSGLHEDGDDSDGTWDDDNVDDDVH